MNEEKLIEDLFLTSGVGLEMNLDLYLLNPVKYYWSPYIRQMADAMGVDKEIRLDVIKHNLKTVYSRLYLTSIDCENLKLKIRRANKNYAKHYQFILKCMNAINLYTAQQSYTGEIDKGMRNYIKSLDKNLSKQAKQQAENFINSITDKEHATGEYISPKAKGINVNLVSEELRRIVNEKRNK